ncbi:MAG: hypothetical protein L3J06_06545 [Cyclobacteriaceae bacterium]|nr:hypothetical protein [Cyclobacteriaceae bacterium]
MKSPNRKQTILMLILLNLLTCSLLAQDKKVEAMVSTWEIGTDLLWLIDKNQVPATSLFGRYNFTNKKNKQMAWRLRLGINTSRKDSSQIAAPQDNEKDIFAPYVQLGFEWQRSFNTKYLVFFGTDINFQYYQNKFSEIIYFDIGPRLFQGTYKTITWGASGFIGFKYFLTNWLSLSLESSLNLNYRIRRDKDKVTLIDYPNSDGGKGEINVNELTIHFTPITVLNLSFYINHK